jgi:putative serine protease PepD
LFITNAHVVTGPDGKVGRVRIVVDCGLTTQRILPAKVLRHDDEIDLALLQVNEGSGLTPLELGQDAGLVELAEVTTFGYPLGRLPPIGRAKYPAITVLPSRIIELRKDKGLLSAVQFDSQLNPGNSGGPVLDGAGKVVAVA